MPPDLPAFLVAELLGWLACDRCDGRGLIAAPPQYPGIDEPCPRPHTVVVHEGRRVYADPERVMWWCAEHNMEILAFGEDTEDSYSACPTDAYREPIRCIPVLRPVVPIDLEEA